MTGRNTPDNLICGLQEGTHLRVDNPGTQGRREAVARTSGLATLLDFNDGVGDEAAALGSKT